MKSTLASWNQFCKGNYGSIMYRRAPVGSIRGATPGGNVTGEPDPITAVQALAGSSVAAP
jgi:hypothetical protein